MHLGFTILPLKKLMHIMFSQKQNLRSFGKTVESVYGSATSTAKLTEDEAVDLGTIIIAEGLIFVVTASIFINEFNKAWVKTRVAEEERKQEIQDLRNAISALVLKIEEQEVLLNDAVDTLGINENEQNLEIIPGEPGQPPRHHHKCFKRIIKHHRVSYSAEFSKNLFQLNQYCDNCLRNPDTEYYIRHKLVVA